MKKLSIIISSICLLFLSFFSLASFNASTEKQEMAAEFTRSVCLVIKNCKEADDSIIEVLGEDEDKRLENLVSLYQAKRVLEDTKKLISKWKHPSTPKEIKDEIDSAEVGINDLIVACNIWTHCLEGKTEASDENTAQLISRIKSGRKNIFNFAAGWGTRIHRTGNNSPCHHIQLTKTQYDSINQYIKSVFSKELSISYQTEDSIGFYGMAARVIDFVVSEELGERKILQEIF